MTTKSSKQTLQADKALEPVSINDAKPKQRGPFQRRPKATGLKPAVASPLPRPEPGRRAQDNVRLSTKPKLDLVIVT